MFLKRLLRGVGIATLSLLLSSSIFAQKTVTGKVTDSKDASPLAGVSVLAKGTGTGTQTKADGTFSLSVPTNANTLVISSVGYATQEVNVAGQTSVNILLVSSGSNLNEVVVVGYGTQRKGNLTGAVAQVSSDVLENRSLSNLSQGLQGVVPNLNLRPGDGKPTQSAAFNIRGTTSIG